MEIKQLGDGMRSSLLQICVLSAGCSLFAHSQVETATNPGSNPNHHASDISELTNLARDTGNAYARRDLPMLEQLTADDYVQTDVRGGILNRTQWLEFVKNRKSDLTVETDNVQISFYGNTAVVRGRWIYRSKVDVGEALSNSRWTSVWTRYDDGWKRHVFQNTYINAEADECASGFVSSTRGAEKPTPQAPNPPSSTENARLPAQMRGIADTLAGTWSITLTDKDGHPIGEGEEVWKAAPGATALIEENRSKVKGESTDDYASIWWDSKAQKVHGIWCDGSINDEGCSGFDVTLEGADVVLTGEWESQRKRQAWREVFSSAGASMTQTLYVGEPGKELKLASTIFGRKR
jgi:ketosteroid isomerase-like protein